MIENAMDYVPALILVVMLAVVVAAIALLAWKLIWRRGSKWGINE